MAIAKRWGIRGDYCTGCVCPSYCFGQVFIVGHHWKWYLIWQNIGIDTKFMSQPKTHQTLCLILSMFDKNGSHSEFWSFIHSRTSLEMVPLNYLYANTCLLDILFPISCPRICPSTNLTRLIYYTIHQNTFHDQPFLG